MVLERGSSEEANKGVQVGSYTYSSQDIHMYTHTHTHVLPPMHTYVHTASVPLCHLPLAIPRAAPNALSNSCLSMTEEKLEKASLHWGRPDSEEEEEGGMDLLSVYHMSAFLGTSLCTVSFNASSNVVK